MEELRQKKTAYAMTAVYFIVSVISVFQVFVLGAGGLADGAEELVGIFGGMGKSTVTLSVITIIFGLIGLAIGYGVFYFVLSLTTGSGKKANGIAVYNSFIGGTIATTLVGLITIIWVAPDNTWAELVSSLVDLGVFSYLYHLSGADSLQLKKAAGVKLAFALLGLAMNFI